MSETKNKVESKVCGRKKVSTMTTRINLAHPVTIYQIDEVLRESLPFRGVITDIEVKFIKVSDKEYEEIFKQRNFGTI